jgi:23S rRNA pseudouridine2605 synthase
MTEVSHPILTVSPYNRRMATRINKFVAQATGLSRRTADKAIVDGQVTLNDLQAALGQFVEDNDVVKLDGKVIKPNADLTTIMLNKPPGYVCSRNGQGSKTVYELLPEAYKTLKPVGRLDKNSSGLLLLTNDGQLANNLTHPGFSKTKLYYVELNKALLAKDEVNISQKGIELDDGGSKLGLTSMDAARIVWQINMSEGRNRQIRRTFQALGYKVQILHRFKFGNFELNGLISAKYEVLNLKAGIINRSE